MQQGNDVDKDGDEHVSRQHSDEEEELDDADVSEQIQQQLDADSSIIEMLNVESSAPLRSTKAARKKRLKLSKHGIEYPSLPMGVVKNLATSFARTAGSSKSKLSKETLDAIMQASDWFFEQASEDLGKYAAHAGRKTIDESDVITLMTRYVHFLLVKVILQY
jgi:histone H3/H4